MHRDRIESGHAREWRPPREPRTAEILRVAVYAGMAELAGCRVIELHWPGGTVAELRAALAAAHPRIALLVARSAVAVGNAYARDEAEVPAAAEVAIIPPVSGG